VIVQNIARDVSRKIAEYKNYGSGISRDAWAIPHKVGS